MKIQEINSILNEHRLPVLRETGKYNAETRASDPAAVFRLLKPMQDFTEEHFVAVALDTKNKVQAVIPCGVGTANTCLCDVRGMFSKLLMFGAVGVIIAHNHPSGIPYPSKEDDTVTKKVAEGCGLLDINFIDHIIIGDRDYYSYTEEERR